MLPAPVELGEKVSEEGQRIKFTWRELRLEGVQALEEDYLRALWPHAPGAEISVADVFAYADSVSRAYAKAGYALSFGVVPQQEIRDGVVTIRVIEGFVESARHSGEPYPQGVGASSQRAIDAHIARLLAERPLKAATLERGLLLINDIPGLSVRATIAPAPKVVGASTIDLDVKARRISGEFGLNSYMPSTLGRPVVGGSLSVNTLVTGVDRLRIGGWYSLSGKSYWSVSGEYSTLVGADGVSLALSGSYAKMRPVSPVLRAIDYIGTSLSANVALRYPLIRSRRQNLFLEGGVSLLDSDADYVAGSLLRDHLRTFEVALTYETTDATRAASVLRLELDQGLDVFNMRGDSRAFGRGDFSVATASLQRLQPIGGFIGGQVHVLFSGYAQRSLRGPLFSAIECSYGGRRFGRRFDAGALSGEHCALGSLELRWGKPGESGGVATLWQLYGFADGGVVRQQGDLVPGEQRERRMASAGGGLRLETAQGLVASFELSRALHKPTDWPTGETLRMTGAFTIKF